ncbi:hypothetical protein ACH4U7_47490 [Streptomyces sp. NPDC020845]|uniref:hypothetical protein n=1 Tax=Streptomyces sp. NPDC020845 TaxID=3365096 RepID=UPI00379E3198
MLLRLAYLAATNALAFLRLLPMNDRKKDVEILVLRHQLLVLQRQAGSPTLPAGAAGPRGVPGRAKSAVDCRQLWWTVYL